MHDPASPSSPDPRSSSVPAPGPGRENHVDVEEAHQIVGAVLAAYSRQLLLARRAGDQQRLEELLRQQRKCAKDRARLTPDAKPEEIARIAAEYTKLFKELDASGPQAEA
ncbi:hypothetical protein [Streptomyces sioyaensis]|uniref:hypothetical protein n=1 Tax=Streptomyces sioyaensis TaxID=67364 RepID=UPI003D71B629